MPACMCVSGHIESNFHHCGGPVKLVRKDVESSFHHCGGPGMHELHRASIAVKTAVFTTVEVL